MSAHSTALGGSTGGRVKLPVLEALAQQDFSRAVLRQALHLAGADQEQLFALARQRRDERFPRREVEVRSVIEISNVCGQQCEYCGMGKPGTKKYVIPHEEFLAVAGHLYASGRRVILLQAGENRSQAFVDHIARCIADAKRQLPELSFILCLGSLTHAQYQQLRAAGGDRYILKYETSNPTLYHRLKPRDSFPERVACLESLISLGFKVGSGNIVGLPGQSLEDLLDDMLFAGKFALSMISCSVFIPGEDSNLREAPVGNADLALNTLALLRLMYPERLMPTTSPFEKVRKNGQYFGLMAGANTVTIHDGTPEELKKLFPIYSGRRFTPNVDHIHSIVHRAELKLAKGPLI